MSEHRVMQNAIKKYRNNTGKTFQELARLTGINSRATVCQHCNGKRGISPDSARKYHQALGIPLSELRPDIWPPTATTPTESESGARDG